MSFFVCLLALLFLHYLSF